MPETIFLSGGAGYIASHCAVLLLEAGYDLVVADNFVNSKPAALERIRQITGRDFVFYEQDLCDAEALQAIFRKEKPDAVIHFAGLKAVGESVAQPLRYYRNNLDSSLSLLEAMRASGCHRIVFSSSATVYGKAESVPIREDAPLSCSNPYGWSKLMIERILKDSAAADPELSVMLLRYFNPVGAHPSGRIGEDPKGIPNNLMPYISQVAIGKLPCLQVFGNDYPTPDGTGVRDYIHVMDLAEGHLAALRCGADQKGALAVNLGTGQGYSVLDLLHAFEKACGHEIAYAVKGRRPGDIAACYADPALAREKLHWEAKLDIDAMCRDSWRWQQMNPEGYAEE